jgi:methyl-accepting chemotaxis protein
MAMLAMWFQETYVFSSGNAKLLMVFIGMVAVSMVVQAIVMVVLAARTTGLVKGMSASVEEVKAKLLPLIDTAKDVGQSAQELLQQTKPKVNVITDNLVKASDVLLETSNVVRASAEQFDLTIADANVRAQRQVARIDGMVTAVLATTTEVVETVSNSIRVPAQKIAGIASQLRYGLEGIYAKVKSRVPGNGSV